MRTHLPLKETERLLEKNMLREKVYTLDELYRLYLFQMNVDHHIRKYKRMTIGSLEKRAREWSGPGMWMVRNNGEDEMVYFKRPPEEDMLLTALGKKVKQFLKRNCYLSARRK